ncbi:MAG: zinc ribbon domain-containing protein [Firmicutes bacterium]|nr:zinc ribbon domain-containing protein [Bacillota bacterium]
MPSYEYRCPKCGKFEIFQRITEGPLAKCPTCGAPVKRLITQNAGIIFKGSGFYVTDHRSSDYKEKAKEVEKAHSQS